MDYHGPVLHVCTNIRLTILILSPSYSNCLICV